MKINDRFLIKTHNGYKNFDGIQKSSDTSGLRIIFDDNTYIECTLTHRILKNNDFICAKDLKINDIINNKKITNIEEIYDKEFYDPVNVEGDNTYEYNDMTNHNCAVLVIDEHAFIPSNRWNEVADSVLPSQSALSWKKNIFISTANGINHFYNIVQGARTHKVLRDMPPDTEIELKDNRIETLEEYYNQNNQR